MPDISGGEELGPLHRHSVPCTDLCSLDTPLCSPRRQAVSLTSPIHVGDASHHSSGFSISPKAQSPALGHTVGWMG